MMIYVVTELQEENLAQQEQIDVQRLHIEKMARMLETLLDTNNNNNNNITK